MGGLFSKLFISVGTATAAGFLWHLLRTNGTELVLKSTSRRHPILGLENVGSSCFLNSILQALASVHHLERWLEHKDEANNAVRQEIPSSSHGFKYPVIAVLFRTVLVLNRVVQTDEYLLTSKLPLLLTRTLRRRGQLILLNEQHDAAEVMQLIFAALNEEVMAHQFPHLLGSVGCFDIDWMADDNYDPINIILDKTGGSNTASNSVEGVDRNSTCLASSKYVCVSYGLHGQPTMKLADVMAQKLVPPFKGLIASKLECISCFKQNSISTESFDILPLHLPAESRKVLVLNTLIQDYLKPTFVHGVDCDGCTGKQTVPVKSSFLKSVAFARMPKILCLHIMRTSWSGFDCRLLKRLDYVMFPLRLNVGKYRRIQNLMKSTPKEALEQGDTVLKYCQAESNSQGRFDENYELKAVICHDGDANDGHYVTLRKCPKGSQQWFYISDELVNPVPVEYVLSVRAYVLLYEHVPEMRSAYEMNYFN